MKKHIPGMIFGLIVLVTLGILAMCANYNPPQDGTPTAPPPPTVTATQPPTAPPPPTVTATRPPIVTRPPRPTAPPPPTATATRPPTATPTATATPAPVEIRIRVILEGYTSKYAPGVFEATIAHQEAMGWHDYPDDLTQFDGFIALEDCDLKGQTVYARPAARGVAWRPFLVADCVGDEVTRQWFKANYIVAEVDHDTWGAWRPIYVTNRGLPIQVGIAENGPTP